MDYNIDLNFPILNHEAEVLIDLNQIPRIEEDIPGHGDEVFDHPSITIFGSC